MRIGGAHGVRPSPPAPFCGMLAAYDAGGPLRGDPGHLLGGARRLRFVLLGGLRGDGGAVLEALFGPGPFRGHAGTGTGQVAAEGGGRRFVPLDPVALALAGVTAEQRYFGKPCGAQDQLASACGGTVLLDFGPKVPTVTPLAFDATGVGYAVVLVDSRQDHSVHTEEFASVPADMRMVANHLGAARLGDADVDALFASLQDIRAALGDGRVMRAPALLRRGGPGRSAASGFGRGDFPLFLKCVRLSGASSAQFLQNVSPHGDGCGERQPAMLIQGLCAHLLSEEGAWRIHGGGFGGSVLALVPVGEVPASWKRWTACSATGPAVRWSWAAPACWRGGCHERGRKRHGRCRGRARQSFLDVRFSDRALGDHHQPGQAREGSAGHRRCGGATLGGTALAAVPAGEGEAAVWWRGVALTTCDLCWGPGEGRTRAGRSGAPVTEVFLGDEPWAWWFSPYGYFPSISSWRPTSIAPWPGHDTIARLLDFSDAYPQWFIGSNADLPIVGAPFWATTTSSGGSHRFPLDERAHCASVFPSKVWKAWRRASCAGPHPWCACAAATARTLPPRRPCRILDAWRPFTFEECGINLGFF